ncbi:MAG: hypothetical protein HFJ33_03010 [Clostridia bacterium]|nr:hypothetical protein [Clostridia bacterium]
MFKQEKREIERIQEKSQQFDKKMEEHREKFEALRESNKRGSELMIAVCNHVEMQIKEEKENVEKSKQHLLNCIDAVQNDEVLMKEIRVAELVDTIIENIDNREELQKRIPDLSVFILPMIPMPTMPEF